MKFTIVQDTGSLTELTHRLFKIEGPGAKTRENEIEASLLAANPHLADLKDIPAGTPIVVPALDVEASPKEAASVAPALVQQVRAQLGGLLESLGKMQADEVAQLEQTQEILKKEDFIAAAGTTAASRKSLAEIESGATDRLKELDQLKKSQQTGIDQLGKNLDDFIQRFL
jgi:hypothetical protein